MASISKSRAGFALIDLLAVLGILLGILICLIPAHARTDTRAGRVVCQSNLRALTAGWLMYAQDNAGLVTMASQNPGLPAPGWVKGSLTFSSAPENWDPQMTLGISPLHPYLQTIGYETWRCPSDLSLVRSAQFGHAPRVRSYSMNDAFGEGYYLPPQRYRTYRHLGEINNPSGIFVLVDEHPDSLNDGSFAVQMVPPSGSQTPIIDYPSHLHSGAAVFSFADGHVEAHRWKGSTIKPRVVYNGTLPSASRAGDSLPDMIWLSQRTSVVR